MRRAGDPLAVFWIRRRRGAAAIGRDRFWVKRATPSPFRRPRDPANPALGRNLRSQGPGLFPKQPPRRPEGVVSRPPTGVECLYLPPACCHNGEGGAGDILGRSAAPRSPREVERAGRASRRCGHGTPPRWTARPRASPPNNPRVLISRLQAGASEDVASEEQYRGPSVNPGIRAIRRSRPICRARSCAVVPTYAWRQPRGVSQVQVPAAATTATAGRGTRADPDWTARPHCQPSTPPPKNHADSREGRGSPNPAPAPAKSVK